MPRDYNIAWEVTESCNHNCFYCYNFWRNSDYVPEHKPLCRQDYERLAQQLLQMQPVSVALTGGEPLLVFQQLKSSMAMLREQGIFLRLLTNGNRITEEIAAFLAQHRIQVMVSFPSADPQEFAAITGQNDYDAVVRGLDLLHKHQVDTLINVVVNGVNLQSMKSTADFLIGRYGYRTLYFSRATRPHNAEPMLQEKLLDYQMLQTFFRTCLQIKKRYRIDIRTCGGYAYCAIREKEALSIFGKGCGGGKSSFVVSNAGDLRVCGKDSQVFGNIFKTDVDAIMDKAVFWTQDSAIPAACGQCPHRQQCRGGCHMSSYEPQPQHNSLDAHADPAKIPELPKTGKRFRFLNPLASYTLHPTGNYCKTQRGNRFSNGFSWVYLSDDLTNALTGRQKITLWTVARLSGLSYEGSKRLLGELLDKRILTEIPSWTK